MNQNQPPALQQQPEEKKGGMFSFLGFGGRRRTKRLNKSKSKSKKRLNKSNKRLNKSNKRLKKRSKKSKMNKKYKGGSLLGGKFTNIDGRQLFTNPVGGIA
jgi:hypothetical protein